MTMSSKLRFNEEFKSQLAQLRANISCEKELCRIIRGAYGNTSDEDVKRLIAEIDRTASAFTAVPKPKHRSKEAQRFDALFPNINVKEN